MGWEDMNGISDITRYNKERMKRDWDGRNVQ
jgi:hypothetical protein